MTEQGEFRRNWRPLAGAFLGIGTALSLNSFILSIFAPYFLKEFGWSREEWSWVSTVQLLVIFSIPVSGRLADRFGVWRIAAIGALSFPVFLVAIALMDGSLSTYFWIYVAQTIVCSTTTSTVYTRVVAQTFTRNRGLAMGLAGASAPLFGALAAPLVSEFVRTQGFTAGYLLVAAFCLAGAVATLWLLWGVEQRRPESERARPGEGWRDYRKIISTPAFWVMLLATYLVNLPFALATTQTKLLAAEQGLGDAAAALMISTLGLSSVAGRFIFGAAVDRLSPPRVAAFGFALPAIGLLLLASPLDGMPVVFVSFMLIGLAFGSEADVIPVLVVRQFGIRLFGTVLGLLTAAMGAAMGGGHAMVALVQRATGSFDAFLYIATGASLVGSAMFLLLHRGRFAPSTAAPSHS